ncbi:hypothetical protein [Fodinicola feengrottensis]|uniref:hypothetical protein n=1 Tax=Fodinicola feengrottensis TaxID=435914 RepID=UPI00244238EC|nr:hypothetical protein [Fodinicola feengrottensis]
MVAQSARTVAVKSTVDKTADRKVTGRRGRSKSSLLRLAVLLLGALVFLFPFYYMLVGSLQTAPDSSVAGAFPRLDNLTLDNYAQINAAISQSRPIVGELRHLHRWGDPLHGSFRAAGRVRVGAVAVSRQGGDVQPGPARPGRAVPVAAGAALRVDRAKLRFG